jgi:hypothetical protein
MMNETLYKRLEDLCARENVIVKLSDNTFRTFVDLLYDDIKSWSKPMEAQDVAIIHRIEEHVSFMVARILTDTHTGTTHD